MHKQRKIISLVLVAAHGEQNAVKCLVEKFKHSEMKAQ